MLDGYIRVAAASPKVRVGDVDYNVAETVSLARKAPSLITFIPLSSNIFSKIAHIFTALSRV